MTRKSKPRAGSLAFYPRKRAARETPSFKTIKAAAASSQQEGKSVEAKPINFLGFKVGMLHVAGKNSHQKAASFGQDIFSSATVVAVPALKVFGIRAYGRAQKGYGSAALFDVFADNTEKWLLRRIPSFRKKHEKKQEPGEKKGTQEGKEKEAEEKAGEKKEVKESEKDAAAKQRELKRSSEKEKGREKASLAHLDARKIEISDLRLLVYSQPKEISLGKKKPEITEMQLQGSLDEKIAFAREMLGKEINAREVFDESEFVDVKAVTKGKGTQGVIKRFGVKQHRPKAKKRRVVGSIGPWNPSTVMWTVARPGQLGYQTRTEYNKRILKISDDSKEINPEGGFTNFGFVKGPYLILRGSVPGPAKRALGLRKAVRKVPEHKSMIESIEFISTQKPVAGKGIEAEIKATKVVVEEKAKQEKKSVEDEIAEAAGKKPESEKK